tara:strand:+ start:210046 stop:211335 length:1290 start_codon:yes stop_codon:yes gene_type:complete
MKAIYLIASRKSILFAAYTFIILSAFSVQSQDINTVDFNEYSGKVVDKQSGKSLVFASLLVVNTNISTITNTDGAFLLKIPTSIKETDLLVSFLGYQKKIVSVSDLQTEDNLIELVPSITELPEINVNLPKNAKALVIKTLGLRDQNNLDKPTLMTAFYRETIKKRRKNVSLAEAIVTVHKEAYSSSKNDKITLYKARKSTDYNKLDTLALKLQGGPFNPLYIDIMKYPEYMFTDETLNFYVFNFMSPTTINEKQVYVVNFKQRSDIEEPLYYGKFYIDAETLALTSAVYSLNVENKEFSSNLFVKRKPKGVKVYPTSADYRVDYREKDGKWFYGYSNVQITFKVNRKRRLFNSVYSLTSEMAITDWKINTSNEIIKPKDRLRPSVVISDEATGFSDPEFWGAYNVIEPEKSIESAINKIQRQLKKVEK